MIALLDGLAFDAPHVRADIGFAQTRAAADLVLQKRGQPLLLLFGRAELGKLLDRAVGDIDDRAQRAPAIARAFHQHRPCHVRQIETAICLGNLAAEIAEILQIIENLEREGAVLLVLVDDRGDVFGQPLIDLVLQHLLFGIEIGGHGQDSNS